MKNTEKLNYIAALLQNDNYSEKEKVTVIKSLINKNSDEDVRMPKYSLFEIQKQVEEETGITLDRMNTEKRDRDVVQARQFAHFKARKFTIEPLEYIGFYFGRKDHATVLHSCKTISGLLKVDKSFRQEHEEFLNN